MSDDGARHVNGAGSPTSAGIFRLLSTDSGSSARAGALNLPHGEVKTPVFMPVGTAGTVKAITHGALEELGFNLILGNTYHLYLRPGMEVMRAFGGLHRFAGWNHNILTDSGGFQVFSLSPFRKVEPEGVYFRSHIDGSSHRLSPELVVEIQETLGSDILMALDVCTPRGIDRASAVEALEITSQWALRSKEAWMRAKEHFGGLLFPIVQGNFFFDLRRRSAEETVALDLPGIAIGGLSVGEEYSTFLEYLRYTVELLPRDKPRYLMGIGTPRYIFDAVDAGIDMFDCVFPTRIARNGTVFTPHGRLSLKRAGFSSDTGPIDERCGCSTCRRYSRGYLRHLFKAGEILGPVLATHHNLHFLKVLIDDIRRSIVDGTFSALRSSFLAAYPETEG